MSIRMMTRIWDDTSFRGTDLLVLLCLADHANDEGVCWPSYATIARRARCSRRQAIRCVQHLQREGWLNVTTRRIDMTKNTSNIFKIVLPSGVVSPPSDICDDFCGLDVTTLVTPMSPEPSGNHKGTIKEPLPVIRQASEKSSKACPSQESADEHVLDNSALDGAIAMQCSGKWYESFGDKDLEDWRSHLGAFAAKWEAQGLKLP